MQRQPAKTQARNQSTQTLSVAKDYAASNPTFLFWAVSNIAAAVLSVIPAPGAAYTAAATAGASNAGVAVSLVARKRIEAAESADKLDRSKFQGELKRLDEDKRRLDEDRIAIAQLQSAIAQKETQLAAIEAGLATQQRTMKDRMTVEAHKEAQAKVEAMQVRLEVALSDKAAMQATYQEKSTEMAKKTGLIVSRVQKSHKDLGDVAAQTIATGNEVLSKERSQVNSVLKNLELNVKAMADELAAQKELVAKLQGPKHFNQSNLEGQTGNKIITFLRSRQTIVSGANIGDTIYGEVVYSFEPINCDLTDVEKQLEPMALHLGILPVPTAEAGNDGTIKMRVRVNSEKRPKASLIKRVPASKLKQAFLDIKFGLRFSGYTGRGKSTLMNNVIDLYEDDLKTKITIFDPKVDFPSADYPNNVVYRGPEKCVANIELIGEVCKARQDYKVLNDEQGVTIPAQHKAPKLFLIDECKDIHDAAVMADADEKPADRVNLKHFKFSIQKGLEVGRGLLVRVLYSTVTPDSSDLGFKNNVFKQSATVFLGDQCAEALGPKSQYLTTVSDLERAKLRQEYEARLNSDDDRDKFIGLFFNGLTNKVFLFSPPMPNSWKTESDYPGFGGVAETFGQPKSDRETAETQAPPLAQSSDKTAEKQPSPNSSRVFGQTSRDAGPVIPSLAEVLRDGANCPDCGSHSQSFKDKKPRKSDSTVRLTCKTKGCPSGGIFRAKVSD
ncbi:MAG: hypothetical protein WBA76_10410 [Phormidesmis sp.]